MTTLAPSSCDFPGPVWVRWKGEVFWPAVSFVKRNEQDAADVGGPEIEAEEVNSEDSNDAAGGSSGL